MKPVKPMPDIGASLARIPLFESLTKAELADVGSRLTVRSFGKNEVILREEETNSCMYMVLAGSVKAWRVSPEGRETILALHGTGESFGEMALLDGKTMFAAVSAVDDAVVAFIRKDAFFELLSAHPKVRDALFRILCARLRDSWLMISMLGVKDAEGRVRALMLALLEEHGERTGGDVLLKIRLTHQSAADMCGLTRETVTRVLDGWKREGLVSTGKERRFLFHKAFFDGRRAL